jgi:hypothetical protein
MKPLPDLDPTKGYVTSLTLENIRCFGSPAETLSLTKPGSETQPARWTVILGANGAGKTTVLRALVLADLNLGLQLGARTARFFNRDQQAVAQRKSIQLSTSSGGRCSFHENGDEFGSTLLEKGRFLSKLAGYGAGRAWRGPKEDDSHASDNLFDRTAQVRDPNETLFRYDYRESKYKNLDRPSRFKAFKKALTSGILPDVVDLRMGFAANDRPIIEFQTPDGWIALDDMSWGYQVFAAFAADYASRMIEWYPDSPAPLHEPGICLVDELDLHMHPSWQRKVIDDLSHIFPATQFIVTVHSPLVVQAAEDANLAVLKRDPDDPSRVQIDNDVEAIKGWRIDQVLTSDLFGLESSRPPSVADDLAERRKLLGNDNLTTEQAARLKILDEQAMSLPTPGGSFEQEALKLVAEAAAKLKQLG